MGNFLCCITTTKETKRLPIDSNFKLSSPIPTWPPGDGFANGIIDMGGLQVREITSFMRICSIFKGGPDNTGVSFFEPSLIPDGFSMLGCYCQTNAIPLFGWVLVGKDVSDGILASPVDYTLVMSVIDDSCYIWLPTPPNGYNPVGYVITSSSEKPQLDKIRCVRADLTDECETDVLLWGADNGVNVYSSRPKNRGAQAQGVCVGTFILEDENNSNSVLYCLKNNNFDMLSSSMPNLAQIEALIQEYSPRLYFHPNETYLPSSTTWYFTNGALLYHAGEESNPVPVEPTGSNLPQGGSNDDTYWLDLPIEETERDRVKKGDLQSSEAYIHIKPMLGGTFTDIQIWVFYPFNGPATAKLGFIDVPLGKIGEHVGDWEHLTLRISNFSGVLYRVYFSEHSGGTWVDTPSLEFQDGSNKLVGYSSLHGHAAYHTPGLVLQGSDNLVGIRNDTAKSDMFMDVGTRYSIVDEYSTSGLEPPWLGYARKWGPKITYKIGTELEKLQDSSSGIVESAIEKLLEVLPSEIYEEDGPTGPKMKEYWDGDER